MLSVFEPLLLDRLSFEKNLFMKRNVIEGFLFYFLKNIAQNSQPGQPCPLLALQYICFHPS